MKEGPRSSRPQSEYEGTIRRLRRAIERHPDYPDLYHQLGVAYSLDQRFDEGIAAFRRALQLQPNYLEAHLNLGLAYSESGQEREARQQFARAAILESRPGGLALGSLRGIPLGVRNRLTSMHVELGDLYLDHGAAAEAAREYHRALRFSPTYPDVRLKLARAHVEMGRTAEALRILESVREHNPTYTEARILLGSLYQICREPGKAREEFEECRRLNPADPRPAVYLRLLDRS